jgi:pimeloyl-ACP methyl ester carboxylesterase
MSGYWAYRRCATPLSGRDYPPIGRFIDVDGVRLHYVDRGEGVPVVLLHGNGATIEDFTTSGLVDVASRGHRVIAFDRPGFGHSERPRGRRWTPAAQAALLERAFARLAIERPVIVGHSWGALVALALAARARAELRGLVLMAGYYYPIRRIDLALAAPLALPIVGGALRTVLGPLIGRAAARHLIAAAFAPRSVPARFARGFPIALCLRSSALRAGAEETALMIPAAAALQKYYPRLAVPVTILAGAEDRLVQTGRHAARLRREIAGSRLHVFAGVGHMVHHAVPKHVVAAVDAVIERSAG